MTTAQTSCCDLNTTKRAYNFSAGPGAVPEDVIRQTQKDLWDLFGSGIGILEHSHRGKEFDRVLEEAEADCRQVGNIPDNYRVLFLQGGATTQCYQIPMAFLAEDATADYIYTGKWSGDSKNEAARYGHVHVAGSSEATGFDRIPDDSDISYSDSPTYVHFTSNNTIMGTEWHRTPPKAPGDAWFVCDASSDIFSRPIDVTQFGLIYAGGQKNLGPAGTVLVIVRDDILERQVRDLPWMLDYSLQAKKQSRFNTPPTFGIYLMGQTFKWIQRQGGLKEIQKINEAKAKVLYDAIDSCDFYKPHARVKDRSLMNVTFKTPSPELDAKFLAEAETHNLKTLKGHRSVGGMRASMYNAFPHEGAVALAEFMKDFAAKNG
ncbi:MAG TPA: 3-phosphoserine/phosphohydroxythreonine transaminase [Phycisphaerales bacterium]|nr:3-phosphoserine/phosphohydroxythreonine transaminase [Phycisphaerales bacterium]